MTGYDWTQATDAVLASVEKMTDAAAADQLGVSEPTVNRWRALRKAGKEVAEPRGKPREVLMSLIGNYREAGTPNADAAALEPATDADVIGLARMLREIEASPVDDVMKILKIEAVSAAIRAEQARIESEAAVIRARAIEKAEGSAETRARAIERAEATAAARADSVREITSGKKDAGEGISDEEILSAIARRLQPERGRASGE